MKNDPVVDMIKDNQTSFPFNFSFIKPVERKYATHVTERLININEYQTNEILIDFFYKKISRTLL